MRIAVVGAGLAGITAARSLAVQGHTVVVFDKGRSPGGRMATRRIGPARLDHGAQFFTVRSTTFGGLIAPHRASGLVFEWSRGFGDTPDGFPRYAVRGGMNALVQEWAAGLSVRCNTLVFAIRRDTASTWLVTIDDGTTHIVDALVVTCPLPQAYSLLVSAELELPDTLIRTEYDRTIAALVTLDRPSAIEAPGALQNPTEHISFASDNHRKGVSPVPAVTLHANADWSREHWDDAAPELLAALVAEATPLLGQSAVVDVQLKKWRFATPCAIWPDTCWRAADDAVVLAGDAFAGPKVEGAVLSGLAAASALTSRTAQS